MEQKFIQCVCPTSPVRKIGCNGVDVKITEIARRIGTQARLLQRRYNPIVIVFDREGREESCDQIRSEILSLLQSEEISADLVIGIPDRNIECWILADYERFLESSGVQPEMKLESFEGKNGKTHIKRLIANEEPYVETVQGVAWLKNARPNIIRESSASFAVFYEPLAILDCWWLRQSELI